MNNNIIITTNRKGIERAELGSDGMWTVERCGADYQVTCLEADPSNPRNLFAGTSTGIIHSSDGGISWNSSGLDGHIVKSLAVSPHNSYVIYAGTKPALMYMSQTGGKDWVELEGFRHIPNRWWWFSPAEPPDKRAYVISIAVSPTNHNVILAGIEFGAVVRSDDGGITWSRHRRGALRDCHALKFHRADGNWVYEAGGTGGGASYSQDSGVSFIKAKRGLVKNYGITCAADPEKPEIWYVCVAPGPNNAFSENPEIYLYRAKGGVDWIPIGWDQHPLHVTPRVLTTVPGKPGYLYAGISNGDVFLTEDYGETWTKMPLRFEGIINSLLIL